MCSFSLCGSIVANPIIYTLVPSPSRFENRQCLKNCMQDFKPQKLHFSINQTYVVCNYWNVLSILSLQAWLTFHTYIIQCLLGSPFVNLTVKPTKQFPECTCTIQNDRNCIRSTSTCMCLIKTKQPGDGSLYLMSDTNSLLFPTERASSIMEHYKQINIPPKFYFQNLFDC